MSRRMTPENMLIRGCLPGEVHKAEAVFVQTYADSADWISKGLAAKTYQAHTVEISGVPQYLIVWHKNDQNVMHVNAVAQLEQGGHTGGLVLAMKEIARRAACSAIQGVTVRAGMVKELCARGFKPVGVMVCCPIA